jgi:hypothetical protein
MNEPNKVINPAHEPERQMFIRRENASDIDTIVEKKAL